MRGIVGAGWQEFAPVHLLGNAKACREKLWHIHFTEGEQQKSITCLFTSNLLYPFSVFLIMQHPYIPFDFSVKWSPHQCIYVPRTPTQFASTSVGGGQNHSLIQFLTVFLLRPIHGVPRLGNSHASTAFTAKEVSKNINLLCCYSQLAESKRQQKKACTKRNQQHGLHLSPL